MEIIDIKLKSLLESKNILNIVNQCYKKDNVFPYKKDVFRAFNLTKLSQTKVVIFGQDPYYQKDVADGLAFSTNQLKTPYSLKNIFKQIKWEYDNKVHFSSNSLEKWAKQGILLINTILTVEENKPLSHKNKGWDYLIKEVIKLLNEHRKNIVFLIWGNQANTLVKLIDTKKHYVIINSHPSPFSFYKNFYQQNIFRKTNDILKSKNIVEIDWNI